MPEHQRQVYAFIGNVRLSQWSNQLTGADGTRNMVSGQSIESKRLFDVPGLFTGNQFSFVGYDQVDAEISTLRNMYGGVTAGPHIWTHSHGSTLGDSATVDQVELGSLRIYKETGQPRFDMSGNLVDANGLQDGFIAYSDVGGAGITGVTSGGDNVISAGVPAGKQLKVNLHPYKHTGSAGTLDAIWESASDSGFTSDVETELTFTQVSSATRIAEQKTMTAAETNTHYRLRVTAISAGTWFLFCSYVVEDLFN